MYGFLHGLLSNRYTNECSRVWVYLRFTFFALRDPNYTRCFIKGTFLFFYNLFKWWLIYAKFSAGITKKCKYKLACRNWCWQLLNSYAWMVNFIWFTDDKLLEFYNCGHKNPKWSLSHACGDSLTFTSSSKSVHLHTPLARWLRFWIARCPISCPMLLSADTMNIFH